MNEEKKNNSADPKGQAEPDNKGNESQPKGDDPKPSEQEQSFKGLEEAKQLRDELKKQNDLLQENLKKAERLSAENILSGHSMAGREPSQEDKITAEARKILKGTGYEDELFPQRQ